jgi:hypothetical protein
LFFSVLECTSLAAGCRFEFERKATMRGLAGYLLIGGFAAVAMGSVTIAGLAVGAHPLTGPGEIVQYVDRTHKGDRLDLHATVVTRPNRPVHKPLAKLPIGCEPAFSPLAVSAHSNYSGRCLAAFPIARTVAG